MADSPTTTSHAGLTLLCLDLQPVFLQVMAERPDERGCVTPGERLHDRQVLVALRVEPGLPAGVAKVNLSSRVGRAFADGIRRTWDSNAEQADLRAYLGAGRAAVERMVVDYFRLCGTIGTAEPGRSTVDWSEALVDAE